MYNMYIKKRMTVWMGIKNVDTTEPVGTKFCTYISCDQMFKALFFNLQSNFVYYIYIYIGLPLVKK